MLDSKRAGESEDGVPIVGTVDEALAFEPNTALVGVVTQGGRFPGDWQELLKSCVSHGLDLENGLHVRLRDIPGLTELAAKHGAELRDLREPPADLSTATGENLEVDATIVLTVGSDCAIGKMTAICELDLEARRRGLKSVFVPTGQTGIAIAGWGISVDAVVSDFLAGAAERLVVEGAQARRPALGRRAGRDPAPDLLGCHRRADPRKRASSVRALPRGGADRRRRRPDGVPDPEPVGAGRPPRAHVAQAPAGEGRGDRAEHLHRLRGGGPGGDRGGRGGDRPAGGRSGPVRGRKTPRCSAQPPSTGT